jgi:glycosyltransferase involved in cell wall biosynthesis
MRKLIVPEISFIIPHKDDPLVDRLLDSLHAQSKGGFEVIVVDSSTDNASLEAFVKWKKLLDLRSIHAKCGRGTARNIGAAAAKAAILVFVDADVVLPRDFVEELMKLFGEDPDLVAVGFPIYPAESRRIPSTVYRILRFLDEFSFSYRKPRIPTTCAAYRRSIFQSRYFLDLVGEDVLFSADIMKYGKALFAKRIGVFEEPRRWNSLLEIPKSLWHYVPAFAANFLILTGLHSVLLPRQENRS